MKYKVLVAAFAVVGLACCVASPPAAAKDVGTSYHKKVVITDASLVSSPGWASEPIYLVARTAYLEYPVIEAGPVAFAPALASRVRHQMISTAVRGRTIRRRDAALCLYNRYYITRPGVAFKILHVDPGLRGC